MTTTQFQFSLRLPRGYSTDDVLSFHGRDSEAVSERISEHSIHKGILLDGVPTMFQIEFDPQRKTAGCNIVADGAMTAGMQLQGQAITSGLLGLRLNPDNFRKFVADDPVFGPLAKKQKRLRIVQSSSIFEALTWAIMGQQINVSFAVTLRRTFVQLAGRRHSSGLWCYPDAAAAAAIDIDDLLTRQYSRSKAETVLRLAGMVASGELDLEISPANPLTAICDALLAIKGIGPWTVNYALLRGYGDADCSLHGDVAVRSAIGKLWGYDPRPDIPTAEAFLKAYSPHRTMAAAHLWASLSTPSGY